MKPVIYLASDSTVQTYSPDRVPQAGWGQTLISCFCAPDVSFREYHPESTCFPQVTCYETNRICIDNRAFAGRSAKTFWEEGRFAEIEALLKPGDYFFFQFAHNDANEKKPERYIPVEEYPCWLDRYVNSVKAKGAVPVLITAIAMRTFDEKGSLPVSFPAYRQAMLDYSAANDIICLDLGESTRQYCEQLGPEATKSIFMWTKKGEYPGGPYCEGSEDNAHLQREGALAFSKLLAKLILDCPKLAKLSSELCL